jgi:hypothetical protein
MKPSVRYDFNELNRFIKNLQGSSGMIVKVGILADHFARQKDSYGGTTNAEIGAKHEFGSFSERIPVRSFLRMPIFKKMKDILEMTKKSSQKLIETGKIISVLKNLGVACEHFVGEAFATSGWGEWKPLQPYTIAHKIQKNPMPLINTSQLRRSITSKVDKK